MSRRQAAVLIVLAVGIAGCSGSASRAGSAEPVARASSSVPSPAATVAPRHVRAGRDVGYNGHGYGHQLTPGAAVPAAAVVEHANAGQELVGLADSGPFLGESYPVISRDGGEAWTVDGPKLWLAAAQGAEAIDYIGGSGRLEFAWGMSLVTTSDGGKRWWRTYLGDAIRTVKLSPGGALVALAITDQRAAHSGQPPKYISWRYRSIDGGRSWTYLGKGAPVHPWAVGSNGKQRPPSG